MSTEKVDVVVIGLGPGGEQVGTSLASEGLSVVGVNVGLVGGECPYYACIPTKMMLRAAESLEEGRRVRTLAGTSNITPQWRTVADRIRDEATTNWDDHGAVERFESSGGRVVRGQGRITAPGEVTVSTGQGEQGFHATRGIVLNPGSEPAIPPVTGLVGTPYWTNREAVQTRELPESLIVLGGGPVGVEFGQLFARFGVAVTLVERGPRLVSSSEPEASETLASVFESEGMGLRLSSGAVSVEYTDGRFTVELDTGESLTAEQLLVATGRTTDLAALGVRTLGIPGDNGTIAVDQYMRAADNVWAVGDVTGKGAFTHTSVYQARIATADVLGHEVDPADYRASPSVTFTDPEVATVGLTEDMAHERGLAVDSGIASIPSSPRGWIHKEGNAGLIKLVRDRERDVLVGATVVGPSGGEMIFGPAVAIQGRVPLSSLRNMIFAYPTFHRAIESALGELA